MAFYIVESYEFSVDHGGRDSKGAIGEYKGSEKIYLHVLPVTDAELGKLKPRVDDNGNVEHARLALPGNDVWWIAVDGEVFWPKLVRPRLRSTCDLASGKPVPVAVP